VDATVTLLKRLLRGERVYEAHRSHAYQWLRASLGRSPKGYCRGHDVELDLVAALRFLGDIAPRPRGCDRWSLPWSPLSPSHSRREQAGVRTPTPKPAMT